MDYSRKAAEWWARNTKGLTKETSEKFAEELASEVKREVEKYGYASLSNCVPDRILERIVKNAKIPSEALPRTTMWIYPKKICICSPAIETIDLDE